MGPREALEKIRALVADAMAAHEIETVRSLLRKIDEVTVHAIGRGTLRRSRVVQARSADWQKVS
jgi:hypothetical protein